MFRVHNTFACVFRGFPIDVWNLMSFEIQTLFYHFDEYIEFRSNFRNSITGIFLYVSKFDMKYGFFSVLYDA